MGCTLGECIAAAGDVSKILLRTCRSGDLVKARVDEAEWMPGHLIGNGDHARPKWCTGTGTPRKRPVSIEVKSHTSLWVSVCCNIWQAASSTYLRLYRLRQALLEVRFAEELAETATAARPGRFIITACRACKRCAPDSGHPGNICRKIDDGSGRQFGGGNISEVRCPMITRTGDDCPPLLGRNLLVEIGIRFNKLPASTI